MTGADYGSGRGFGMTQFQWIALNARLKRVERMLNGPYFDICCVREVFTLLMGNGLKATAVKSLEPLHGIDWADMPDGSREEVSKAISEGLYQYIPKEVEIKVTPNCVTVSSSAIGFGQPLTTTKA